MHEFAVCQALLTEVQRISREHCARAVTRIVVRMGPLSGVEPRLLERAFDFARVGSVAAEAELCIESTPVRVQCLECDGESEPLPNRLVCAHCGGWRTRLISGDELLLQRLVFDAAASGDAASERLRYH